MILKRRLRIGANHEHQKELYRIGRGKHSSLVDSWINNTLHSFHKHFCVPCLWCNTVYATCRGCDGWIRCRNRRTITMTDPTPPSQVLNEDIRNFVIRALLRLRDAYKSNRINYRRYIRFQLCIRSEFNFKEPVEE